ncbi:hypothetical protein P280DRAFT_246274 [Massarina eburnea CBS 473.64]|uniref:Uncharacterized protein n=1 Tax=Massarina eburnea CBS 473.64 TaxID=1395130 RepID=A0A6A6S7K0_9PLEO|nr:hypothetical protein P280DRAFT_246274 [Massarina eburnea CBS 473.64]
MLQGGHCIPYRSIPASVPGHRYRAPLCAGAVIAVSFHRRRHHAGRLAGHSAGGQGSDLIRIRPDSSKPADHPHRHPHRPPPAAHRRPATTRTRSPASQSASCRHRSSAPPSPAVARAHSLTSGTKSTRQRRPQAVCGAPLAPPSHRPRACPPAREALSRCAGASHQHPVVA